MLGPEPGTPLKCPPGCGGFRAPRGEVVLGSSQLLPHRELFQAGETNQNRSGNLLALLDDEALAFERRQRSARARLREAATPSAVQDRIRERVRIRRAHGLVALHESAGVVECADDRCPWTRQTPHPWPPNSPLTAIA